MTNSNHAQFFITTFYQFLPLENHLEMKSFLEDLAVKTETLGLTILGSEGINSTIASKTKAGLETFKSEVLKKLKLKDLLFKDSNSEKAPFRRFKVKIREEIVTLGTPELIPPPGKNKHLTPAQWNEVLKNEKDVLVIDTRNWYETKIGTFKNAVNPRTDQFKDFPKFMEQNNYDKEKKVLIFCTGGIRCERGLLELERQGFKDVHQLEGGILNYIQHYPDDQFEGECFVFDQRVALDQKLKPTVKYNLCPHCGQPATIAITCKRCDSSAHLCDDCEKLDWKNATCSKNCAYQLELHPDRKGTRQDLYLKTKN